MPLYKHTAKFTAPLKGLSIVPEQPPEPPAPTFSKEELDAQVQQARQQGAQQAQQQLNAQIQQMHKQASALQSGVLQGLNDKMDGCLQEIYTRMPDLVMALVRRVLVDVKMTPESIKAVVLDTLSEISSESEQMEVRLCPADLELLKGNDASLESRFPRLSFRADENLSAGDCMLHSRFGLVDARVETKLQKILDDLKGQS